MVLIAITIALVICLLFYLYGDTVGLLSYLILAIGILIYSDSTKTRVITGGSGHLLMIPNYQEVKLVKQLGKGYHATVYLSQLNDRYVVTRYSADDPIHIYNRLLEFDKDVCKTHPGIFMSIISSAILPKGFVINYIPILDKQYTSVRYTMSDDQTIDMIAQIINQLHIMKLAGYRHRDINERNLMVSKKAKWYLIDYGDVWHNSFTSNEHDEYLESNPERNNDLLCLVKTVMPNKIYKYLKSINSVLSYEQIAEKILASVPILKSIKPFIPETLSKHPLALSYALEINDPATYIKLHTDKKPDTKLTERLSYADLLLKIIKHAADSDYSMLI